MQEYIMKLKRILKIFLLTLGCAQAAHAMEPEENRNRQIEEIREIQHQRWLQQNAPMAPVPVAQPEEAVAAEPIAPIIANVSFIAEGADVNAKDFLGRTALMFAAKEGNKEIYELLIAKSADVNAKDHKGKTAQMLADQWDQDELNRKCINAAKIGDKQQVKQFIEDGADVNAKNEDRDTALMKAAQYGHQEVCELLIANNADIKTKDSIFDYTALKYAAQYGHKKVCELLIANNADINAKSKNCYGTALHSAASEGHIEVCKLLIANGVDVHAATRNGTTALINAARDGRKKVCELLIANGADVNAKLSFGWTPLINAARRGHKEVCELLIANHADIYLEDNKRQTALMLAAESGKKEICELLIDVMLRIPIAQATLNQMHISEDQKNTVGKLLGIMKKSNKINKDLYQFVARSLVNAFKREKMIKVEINRIENPELRKELLDYLTDYFRKKS
jgi:ankyrin repeat protein